MRKASLFSTALLISLAAFGCSASKSSTAKVASAEPSYAAQLAQKTKSVLTPSKTAKPTPPPPAMEISPGADLHVQMAELQKRGNQLDGAAVQYQKALEKDPNHLGALLGYAQLQDLRGNLEDATKHYEKAAAKHPKHAAVHNDLGLCYARRGMLDQSVKSLEKAVELEPRKTLYRNNIATVLVEQKRIDEALKHLQVVHSASAAYHNVGYLLQQGGDTSAAIAHFQMAVEKDPSFTPSQQWLAKLTNSGSSTENVAAVKPIAPSEASLVNRTEPVQREPVQEAAPRAKLKAQVVHYPHRSVVVSNDDSAPVAPMPDDEASPSFQSGPVLRLLPAVE